MLVLTRKIGERIVIPELGVALTVVDMRAGRVRLGILAPEGVAVHRLEVWQRLQAAGPEADVYLPRSASGQRRLES